MTGVADHFFRQQGKEYFQIHVLGDVEFLDQESHGCRPGDGAVRISCQIHPYQFIRLKVDPEKIAESSRGIYGKRRPHRFRLEDLARILLIAHHETCTAHAFVEGQIREDIIAEYDIPRVGIEFPEFRDHNIVILGAAVVSAGLIPRIRDRFALALGHRPPGELDLLALLI